LTDGFIDEQARLIGRELSKLKDLLGGSQTEVVCAKPE
jgi:hypothetical protein